MHRGTTPGTALLIVPLPDPICTVAPLSQTSPDSPGSDGACRPPACWRRWGTWRHPGRPARRPWAARPPAPGRGCRPDSSGSPASTADRWACSGNTYRRPRHSRSQSRHLHPLLRKPMWRHVTYETEQSETRYSSFNVFKWFISLLCCEIITRSHYEQPAFDSQRCSDWFRHLRGEGVNFLHVIISWWSLCQERRVPCASKYYFFVKVCWSLAWLITGANIQCAASALTQPLAQLTAYKQWKIWICNINVVERKCKVAENGFLPFQ